MATSGRSFKDLFKSRIFFKLDLFFDAILLMKDGTEFRVHKLILSKRSGYFLALFRSGIGEKKDCVTLEFNGNLMENILIFLYTGEIQLNERNIVNLIIAADFLLIDSLLMHCRQFALREISVDSCIPLLAASQVVERLGLADHCYRCVQVHFGSLVRKCSSEIAELPLNILKNLLKDDSLSVPDEETVWKAIVIWVNKNAHERLENVPELLSCLRWTAVNNLLTSCIIIHPIFQDNISCKNIDIEELINASKYAPTQHNLISAARCPHSMYIFLRQKSFPNAANIVEVLLTYDEQLDIWRKVNETGENFHNLISLGKFLFLFNTMSNRLRIFDLVEKTWHEKDSIPTSRQNYWVIKAGQRIYVIGGFLLMSNAQLQDVESYDLTNNMWAYCEPVPNMMICGVATVNEIPHVIGYTEDSEKLEMKAMIYDVVCDNWIEVNKPKYFRTQFAAIGFQKFLYILGGRTEGHDVTLVVERYHAKINEWEDLTPLPFYYEQPHSVILQDKLMIYEDCPPHMFTPRFSPCVWNADTEMWDVVNIYSAMNEIHRYIFCRVDDPRTLSELCKENKDPETKWTKTPFI